MFTYDHLCQISDESFGVLNRNIDMTRGNKSMVLIVVPRLIHHFAHGEPHPPHLRNAVIHPDTLTLLAYQDMTFTQWDRGQVVEKS